MPRCTDFANGVQFQVLIPRALIPKCMCPEKVPECFLAPRSLILSQLSSFHFTMESISVSHPQSYLGELPWRVSIILQVTEQNGCFNIT